MCSCPEKHWSAHIVQHGSIWNTLSKRERKLNIFFNFHFKYYLILHFLNTGFVLSFHLAQLFLLTIASNTIINDFKFLYEQISFQFFEKLAKFFEMLCCVFGMRHSLTDFHKGRADWNFGKSTLTLLRLGLLIND